MSIFRYLLSHDRSDHGDDNYYRGDRHSRHRPGPGHEPPRAVVNEKQRCPHCQSPQDIEASFCNGCGKSLISRCSQCQQVLSPQAAFCEKCGKPTQTLTRLPE